MCKHRFFPSQLMFELRLILRRRNEQSGWSTPALLRTNFPCQHVLYNWVILHCE